MADDLILAASRLNLLLVEDNPLDAELFIEFLAEAGGAAHHVDHVTRLSLAEERLRQGGVDVVFLDFILPDSEGLNALARLRRCAPQVPVILLTGLDDDEVGLRAVAAGAQDYLVKGQIPERTIWRVLRHAIVRKRVEEEARERQLLEARVQEAQRAESLEILAGGVAHEFNNLLTGILGNASIALSEAPVGSALLPLLQDIQTAAQRAAGVTAQMLAYSGHGCLDKQDLDLSRLVFELMPLMEPVVRASGRLIVQVADRPLLVRGAAAELRQVVVSLVTNAVEALREADGSIRIATGLQHLDRPTSFIQGSLRTELPPGDYALVTVADTGCGIPMANLARIFDPFFTTKFAGRGLGLSTVLGLVRSHQGAVRVSSTEGQGTMVEVFLPLAETAAAQAALAMPVGEVPGRWPGLAVVIDDEPLIVSLTRKILGRHGLEVVAAPDWAAGQTLARAQKGRLRLVMQDADRLLSGGRDVLAAWRDDGCGVPLLLWGSHSEDEAARLFGQVRGCAFLHKPFPPAALLAKVQHLLGRGDAQTRPGRAIPGGQSRAQEAQGDLRQARREPPPAQAGVAEVP